MKYDLLGTDRQSFCIQISALDLREQRLTRTEVELVRANESDTHFEQVELLLHELASMNRAVVKPEDMAPSPDGVRLIQVEHQLLEEPVEGLAGVEAVVDCEVESPVTANGCDDVELWRSELVGQVLLLIAEGPALLSEVGLVKRGLVDAHDHLALMKELDVSSSRHLSLEDGCW